MFPLFRPKSVLGLGGDGLLCMQDSFEFSPVVINSVPLEFVAYGVDNPVG